jgi:hypothetical protein
MHSVPVQALQLLALKAESGSSAKEKGRTTLPSDIQEYWNVVE